MTYKIFVAANATEQSYEAINFAAQLCKNLKDYKLIIGFFVPLNSETNIPYLDHLDKSYNMEIQEQSEKELKELKGFLKKNYYEKVDYDFFEVEGEGEAGPLIKEYLEKNYKDINLCCVGSRHLGGLKKLVYGSTSEYLVHNLSCPVTIVSVKNKKQ
ncbi:hypothetical protein HDU92_007646 [Lobulomyces angularis]|nr:hypothetical protein HDU92_007646 [Lobulomyces angularis]